jgi:hypothetical protein
MMNHHTIRVYLPYADTKHYEFLRQSLRRIGIQDFIQQSDGKSFKLPQGEFYIFSSKPSDEIREMVYEIAAQISKAAVLVTSGNHIAWVGLESAS